MTQRNDLRIYELITDYPENEDELKQLLQSGITLESKNINGKDYEHPIKFAADLKLWNCVRFIASEQRDPASPVYMALLNECAKLNDYQTVEALIKAGTNLVADANGETAFHQAVNNRSMEILKLLLVHFKYRNTTYVSPLIKATDSGYWNCVSVILEEYPPENYDIAELAYILRAACKAKKINIAEKLIAIKDVAKFKFTQITALYYAVTNRDTKLIKSLIAAGAPLDVFDVTGHTPMSLAAHLEYTDCIRAIVESTKTDAADSYYYGYALRVLNKNDPETALLLIRAGAKPNTIIAGEDYPIHVAVRNEYTEVIAELIKHNASLSSLGSNQQSPMMAACNAPIRWKSIEAILASGGNTTVTDSYNYGAALVHAVEAMKIDLAKALLKAGASANYTNTSENYTPLHWAAKHNLVELIEPLIRAGANLAARDKACLVPMITAVKNNCWTAVIAIAKAKKDDKGAFGYPYVLTEAIKTEQPIETIELFIKAGANTPYQTEDLNTPTHWAVIKNNIAALKLLLAAGALLHFNINNKTPLQIALDEGKWDMVAAIANASKPITDARVVGMTLTAAIKANQLEAARALLAIKIEKQWVITVDEKKCTYDLAVDNDSPEMIDLLKSFKAPFKNKHRQTDAFTHAFNLQRWNCARALVQLDGVPVNGDLLARACMANQTELAKELLAKGASITDKAGPENRMPLHWAVQHNNMELVKELLKKGASQVDFDANKETPLLLSGRLGHFDIVLELLNAIPKPRKLYKTISYSIKTTTTEIIKLILKDAVIDPKLGPTYLYEAVKANRPDVVILLLQHGCKKNEKVEGKTLSEWAKELKFYDCWKCLEVPEVDGSYDLNLFISKAAEIFQTLQDNSVLAKDTPNVLRQLNKYQEAIFKYDLIELQRRRLVGDASAEFLIKVINQMLSYNDQISPEEKQSIECSQAEEAKHIKSHELRQLSNQNYVSRVRDWLIQLEHEIKTTKFRVTNLIRMEKEGTPKHLLPVVEALQGLNKSLPASILDVYEQIIISLNKVVDDKSRDPNTERFYQHAKTVGNSILYNLSAPAVQHDFVATKPEAATDVPPPSFKLSVSPQPQAEVIKHNNTKTRAGMVCLSKSVEQPLIDLSSPPVAARTSAPVISVAQTQATLFAEALRKKKEEEAAALERLLLFTEQAPSAPYSALPTLASRPMEDPAV